MQVRCFMNETMLYPLSLVAVYTPIHFAPEHDCKCHIPKYLPVFFCTFYTGVHHSGELSESVNVNIIRKKIYRNISNFSVFPYASYAYLSLFNFFMINFSYTVIIFQSAIFCLKSDIPLDCKVNVETCLS
jgi:hypothetical protein